MKRLVAGVVVAGVLTVASTLPTSLIRARTYAATQQAAQAGAATPSDIVATAEQYLGSSYAYIGNSPSTGFSCIGFVNFVFHQNGVNVPFDTDLAWNSAPHVAFSDLIPGDVVFFSNTVFAGLSHVAIYIGNDQMIGADSFAVGVTTDRLSDAYWMEHYTGATRPLALIGTAPMPGTGSANTGTAAATPVPTAAPILATAAAGTLLQPLATTVGMYSGPGYSYTPITTLGPSSVLVVVQSQGSWYDVQFGNIYGWVNAADVGPSGARTTGPSKNDAPPNPSATATPSPTAGFTRAAARTSTVDGTVFYVAQGPLKIHSGPGKDFPMIGFLRVGTRLVEHRQQPGWAYVTTPAGMNGWVDLEYLTRATPTTVTTSGASRVPSQALQALYARVIASVLNVRADASSHGHVITVLFAGERVQVLSQGREWDRIKLRNGTVGWASARWLALQS